MATATAPTQAKHADLWSVLSARAGRQPGRVYKRGEAAYVDGIAADPVVDLNAMSATFCLSKPIEDRSRDMVNPEGFMLENYRLNPVVFFDHGFSGYSMPIGKSEDPNGSLTVVMSPDEVLGTCYFSKTTPEGYQTFGLVEEKILRAASVNIMPIDADIREADTPTGRPGLLIKSCELIEWSVVGIPDNPEAVRKLLDLGKIGGEAICAPILKSLRTYAAPIVRTGRGWTPGVTQQSTAKTGGDPVADDMIPAATGDDKRKAADEAIAKAARLKKEADDAAALAKSLAKAAGDEAPEGPGGGDADDSAGSESPMGAQVLKAAYDSLSELTDSLDQAGKVLEHPQVKEFVESLADEVRGQMEKCYGLHKEHYPDEPELAKDMDSADPDNANNSPSEASGAVKMANFLARSKSHRLSLKGVNHELMRLAACKNLTTLQRESIQRLSKSLARVNKAAESGSVEAPASDALKRLESLEKAIDGIADVVQKAIPHRRT